MRTQNKAGISLPQDLADNFPTSLMSAIAHLQVARDWLQDQKDHGLGHLPKEQRKDFTGQIIDRILDINDLDDKLCELLFDIFASQTEGLPHFQNIVL